MDFIDSKSFKFSFSLVLIFLEYAKDLEKVCSEADILIAAVGRPEMIKESYIKEGCIVIDVGINRIEVNQNNETKMKLVGDVKYNEAEKKAYAITPVPGGVGPMTIACLLRNTTIAFKNSINT